MEDKDKITVNKSSCPCLHIEPCMKNCTCVNSASSAGCQCCCSYGSPEQQKAAAEFISIAIKVSQYREQQLRECLERIQKCSGNKCAWLYETPERTCKERGLSQDDTCPFCLAEAVLGKDKSPTTH